MGKCKECVDHKGNKFKSINEMCRFWHISDKTYRDRIKSGWSLEDTLETPIRTNKVFDHLDNCFSNEKDMCEFWNITLAGYKSRIKRGWNIKKALETPLNSDGVTCNIKCEDHLGNKFKSKSEMYKYWDKNDTIVRHRLKNGWSLKDALEFPKDYIHPNKYRKYIDHKGNEFSSIEKMANFWGISKGCFNRRHRRGLSLQECLEGDKVKFEVVDYSGKSHKSITEMCKYYGISISVYNDRIKKGMSEKEALLFPKTKGTSGIAIVENNNMTLIIYTRTFYTGIDKKKYIKCMIDEYETFLNYSQIVELIERGEL